MHHLLVFNSAALAQNSVLAGLTTVTDQVFSQFNTLNYTPQNDMKLLRCYARGANGTEVRIDTPILRPVGPPQIQPIDTAANPPNMPPINKYDGSALTWFKSDPLGVLFSRGGAAVAQCSAAFWVSDRVQTEIDAPCRSVLATASVTLTTSGWVAANLTFSQQLPPGRYQIIGMSAQGTGLLFARLVIPNQIMRPGVLAQEAAGEYDHEWFRRGAFGGFGQFESFALPTAEFFGFTAGAITASVWLDVVPINVPTQRF